MSAIRTAPKPWQVLWLALVSMACIVGLAWHATYLDAVLRHERITRQHDVAVEAMWAWERLATSGPAMGRATASEQVERLEAMAQELHREQVKLAIKVGRLTFGRVELEGLD